MGRDVGLDAEPGVSCSRAGRAGQGRASGDGARKEALVGWWVGGVVGWWRKGLVDSSVDRKNKVISGRRWEAELSAGRALSAEV